jgi:hypothetical protein
VFLLLFLWLAPKIFRAVRLQLAAFGALLGSWFGSEPGNVTTDSGVILSGLGDGSHNALHQLAWAARPIPEEHARSVEKALKLETPVKGIRAAATKKIRGLRNSVGYLVVTDDGLAFVTRRWFANRVHRIPFAEMRATRFNRGIWLNRFRVETASGDREFYVFKDLNLDNAPAAHPQQAAKSPAEA